MYKLDFKKQIGAGGLSVKVTHKEVFYFYLFLKFPPRTGHDTELGML